MKAHWRTSSGWSRRRALAALGGAAAGGVLAACGGAAQTEGPGAATAGPVALTVFGAAGGVKNRFFPEQVTGFNAKQSRITASFSPWPPGQTPMTLGAAGSLPDTMDLVASGIFAPSAAKGFCRDLGPLMSQAKVDLKPFYPAALDSMKFRAKQYALPYIAHPGYSTYYANLDLLQQAGVREPDDTTWTWAQAQAMARQLSAAGRGVGDVWGMAPPTEVLHVTVAARAFGGNVLDKDGKRSIIAETAAAQGVQWIADLLARDRGAPLPGVLTGSQPQSLVGGQVAMVWFNLAVIDPLRQQSQGMRWRAYLAPKGPQSRGLFLGVDGIGISSDSKQPDAAFELAKHFASKEAAMAMLDLGHVPGARQDTWNEPKVTNDPALKVLSRAMAEAAPLIYPANGLTTEYNQALAKELANIWSGKVSVKDGLEATRRAGQEVLDQGG